MKLLAVVDATAVDAPTGPATKVAGLNLLERTARLAAVCGADEIVICLPEGGSYAPELVDTSSITPPLAFWRKEDETPSFDDFDALLLLDAGVVYERASIRRLADEASRLMPGQILSQTDGHASLLRLEDSDLLRTLVDDIAEGSLDLSGAEPHDDEGWTVVIDSPDAVKQAESRLWQGCRKAEDGLVSRYLNRHISIALSKLLVSTAIKPNHITTLTFALGIAAALSAARGEYMGFLLAGILYQLNSVIDGVDGELARVRYEFSVTGEWLDTISDDMADLLIYIGLGVGAWRTVVDVPGPMGPELWLMLGLTAGAAKIASMVVYYRWLIAHGRGDLLAFQWSFEDETEQEENFLSRALSATRYFFRKDFIVFAAMLLSFVGFLPHLLIALAPGNVIVAISVVIQQARSHKTVTTSEMQ